MEPTPEPAAMPPVMPERSKKKVVFVALLTLAVLTAFGGMYYWQNSKNQQLQQKLDKTNSELRKLQEADDMPIEVTVEDATSSPTLTAGDFGDNGDFGTLMARGYVTTQKVPEAFCDDNCPEFTYASFVISETKNPNILNYLKAQSGNAFVKDNAIGMGCIVDNVIRYSNNADTTGQKEYTLSKDESLRILAATAESPITLEITKLKQDSGSGAPTCYSHFTTFKIVL